MLITMICLKLKSEIFTNLYVYSNSHIPHPCRGRGNHSKRFYDTKEIPRAAYDIFLFAFVFFLFIWVFITAFDPDFTIDLAHKKTQVLDPLLALTCAASALGRYKCYTCSGGGRTGDIGRRLTPFCYHKGFNSQLPRKKFGASKPESECLECHSRLSLWIFMSWIFKRINTLEISLAIT